MIISHDFKIGIEKYEEKTKKVIFQYLKGVLVVIVLLKGMYIEMGITIDIGWMIMGYIVFRYAVIYS